METAGVLAALDIANAALVLIQNAAQEGRDVSADELAGLSSGLQAKIDAFQAKLDAVP